MANTRKSSRRPYVRQSRKNCRTRRSAGQASVFEPLEPRKLLTTLYAFPADGQFSTFVGWVAMPAWFGSDTELEFDASEVGSRSVLVEISIMDVGPEVFPSPQVTILDLAGNPMVNWVGQFDRETGEFVGTDVEVSLRHNDPTQNEGDDFWGTGDDVTFSGFGLDTGYVPGWSWSDPEDVDSPFEFFREFWGGAPLDFDPDEGFDPEAEFDPNEYIIIPETGTHYLLAGGTYVGHNFRLPEDYGPDQYTDDRELGTADDPETRSGVLPGPFDTPDDLFWHRVDRLRYGLDSEGFVIGADDGVADFNNGIGQIIFSNVRSTTRLVMRVFDSFEAWEDGEPSEPFQLPGFGAVGVGLMTDEPTAPPPVWQAPGMGQIIIGNPTNVNWADHENLFPMDWRVDYSFESDPNVMSYRNREGIYFEDPTANETMGRVFIDGALFGVSRFPGALEIAHMGYLGGDIVVDGDLDSVVVYGDAGFWRTAEEDDEDPLAFAAWTGSSISVGRTLGSFIVGGTLATEVNVEGDLDPSTRIDKPFLREGSVVLELENPVIGADDLEQTLGAWGVAEILYFPSEPGEVDLTYYHNDTIGRAQYVGRVTNRVEVSGYVGVAEEFDAHSETGNRDDVDWYSVAVDGQQRVRISGADGAYLTVRDERGRIVASRGMNGLTGDIVFTPNESGLIYVVVGGDPSGDPTAIGGYSLSIRGIAPVTFGEVNAFYRTIYVPATTGISTTRGSVGAVRTGLEVDTFENLSGSIVFMTINSAGSLWNISSGTVMGGGFGADEDDPPTDGLVRIEAVDHIGQIFAGFARAEAEEPFVGGSLYFVNATAVRGNIGRIWAESDTGTAGEIGGLGTAELDGALTWSRGASTFTALRGSIGVIHATNRIAGYQASNPFFGARFEVGPNGIIDLIEVAADLGDELVESNRDLAVTPLRFGIIDDEAGVFTGAGGNVRFFRAPNVFATGEHGSFIELFANQALTLVDDSGAEFSIRITAGVGKVVLSPIQNSLGVSVSQLIVDLAPGADLIVTNNSGRVELGDIIVMGSTFDSGQNIIFDGTGRTDVYLLRAIGDFDRIENSTRGDMIAIDVRSVNRVRVAGSLGHTTTTAYGPKKLGPLYGIVAEEPTEPTGDITPEARALAFGIPSESLDWVVGSQIQINPAGFFGENTEDLDIIGSPVDPYLNGIIIRDTRQISFVEEVEVGGALGDLIVQSTLERVIVNSDGVTPLGEYHGVVGTVYAQGDIEFIDVGDGLIAWTPGPWLDAGIIAQGAIHDVLVDGEGRSIEGFISARGLAIFPVTFQDFTFFIDTIEARNGASIDGAYITTDPIDDFWWGEGRSDTPFGDINQIRVNGGGVLRDSTVRAVNIGRIEIKGGAWDANHVFVSQNIGRITADLFTATRDYGITPPPLGTSTEIASLNVSLIQASGNVDRIETHGGKGDILNLTVDIQGNLGQVRANNVEDLTLQVDNFVQKLDAKGRLTRSTFVVGGIDQITVDGDIARTTINVAGPIDRLQSKQGRMYKVDINVTGPDGAIDRLEAAGDISGEISVTGPIDRIRSKSGDITALVQTTGERGHVGRIEAQNLFLTLDISGNVDKLKAADTLGSGDIIRIRGDLGQVDVKNGTFDSRLVVEGALTKKFQAGSITSGSDIEVSRSIKAIDIGGGIEDLQIISHSEGIDKLDIDGDVESSSLIAAYNGGMNKIRITGGDVDGEIHSDEEISKLQIRSSGGVGGNVTGRIESDTILSKIDIDGNLAGGEVMALHTIEKLDIDGNVSGGAIISAGRVIERARLHGSVNGSFIIAGLEALGDDEALGGTLTNLDTYSSGNIERLDIDGNLVSSFIIAGINAGTDGTYAGGGVDPDTDLPPGLSVLDRIEIRGEASGGSRIMADTAINDLRINGEDIAPGSGGAGFATRVVNPDLPDLSAYDSFTRGEDFVLTESDGDQITFSLNGSGTGYVLTGGAGNIQDVLFVGTDSSSSASIRVTTIAGDGLVNPVTAATIRGFDDANFGTLDLGHVPVTGDMSVLIDGDVNSLRLSTVNTTGAVQVGSVAGSISTARVSAGDFMVTEAGNVNMSGGFSGNWQGEILNSFTLSGNMTSGVIYARDVIGSISISGAMGQFQDGANIATDGSIHSLSAGSAREAIVSAGDVLENVRINGDVIDSDFLAGLTLGSDADYGGTGTAADELTDGVIQNVFIRGNFIESNIVAGVTRGTAMFYGDNDDIGALGFSQVINVTIQGAARGSNFFTESFAIGASGEVVNVTARGTDFEENGNLSVVGFEVSPLPVIVTDVETRLESLTFLVDIFFNHDLDEVSVTGGDPLDPVAESAISIVNDEGGVDPTELDYSITYNDDERRATIEFERAFTRDNPGIYRIIIDATVLRSAGGVGLDGNSDGVIGDDFETRIIVGDAGDRTAEGTWDFDGDLVDDVTFFEATDLDLLITDPISGDRTNNSIQFAGRVGDHAEHDPLFFPGKMDLDLYSITLQPGETLQVELERAPGTSGLIGDMFLWRFIPDLGLYLPVLGEGGLGQGFTWNGNAAETFYLGISGTSGVQNPARPVNITLPGFFDVAGFVILPDEVFNDFGNYSVTAEIFDDGDTGFDGRGTDTAVQDGVTKTFFGEIGNASNGNPSEAFLEADVYDITMAGGAVLLEEGTTVTITLRVNEIGSTLGAAAEFGLFQLTGGGVDSGELVAAPGYTALYDEARNLTITVEVPEDGEYAVYVQGSVETDYELDITVDRTTAGPIVLPARQNVLLETNGGFAEWLGRLGTDLKAFDLTNLGFEGQENVVISGVIDEVEQKFEDAGVTVNVELNPANFGRQNFSTVFLATNFVDDVEPATLDLIPIPPNDTPGIPEKFDAMNQDKNDEAVVFVEDFGFFDPSQRDLLIDAIANAVAHEVGHLLGLRHVSGDSVMDDGVNSIAASFSTAPLSLPDFLLGVQDDQDMLQYVLASA